MTNHISVLLADDHALVRETLRDRLEKEPDMTVVASVANADEAVEQALLHKPDVVLLDIDMPGKSCFDAARTIQTECPGTRTIFLSSFFNDNYIDQALDIEAAGYLTKGESAASVIQAIRTARAGRRHFSPQIESRIVLDVGRTRLAAVGRSRKSTLSNRELEILRYIARGMSQRQIAQVTHRSERTIHTHCNNIMVKLDIHDRVALTRFAIREGLAEA